MQPEPFKLIFHSQLWFRQAQPPVFCMLIISGFDRLNHLTSLIRHSLPGPELVEGPFILPHPSLGPELVEGP